MLYEVITNALACSAANAALDLFEMTDVLGSNIKKSAYIREKLSMFEGLTQVKAVRQTGMVAAVELQNYDAQKRMGLKVYQFALEQGVLLRPLGNVVYFMPPYVITFEEIDMMMGVAYDAICSLPAVDV